MRSKVQKILNNQSQWQRSRVTRPWADKIRDAATMREAVIKLRHDREKSSHSSIAQITGATGKRT
jgi:hypothetical protein